jgi:hypothetical protein
MLHPQVLAQERRFLLQIEWPDTEDKGCERTEAREEEGDMDLVVRAHRSAQGRPLGHTQPQAMAGRQGTQAGGRRHRRP